jgi:hypothetical protein
MENKKRFSTHLNQLRKGIIKVTVYVDRCLSFCNYMTVLFRFMDSDHLFGIFKLFLSIKRKDLLAQAYVTLAKFC